MALLSLLFVGSLWGGFKGLEDTEKILGQQLPVSLVSSLLFLQLVFLSPWILAYAPLSYRMLPASQVSLLFRHIVPLSWLPLPLQPSNRGFLNTRLI